MKFGKLLRHTVDSRMPQWRNYTLAYKQLKQHIKQLQAQLAQQGARSPAQLSSRLPECTSPVPHHAWTALEPAADAAHQRPEAVLRAPDGIFSLAYAPPNVPRHLA